MTRPERILLLVFVATLPLVNPYLRGDGNGYYAYVRSAVIDHDLQFENEYRRGDPDFLSVVFRYSDGHLRDHMPMPTGHVRNQWSVGSSILWAPFFVEAHALVCLLGELGFRIPADGYSLPYRAACAFGSALFAFVGLLLAYRTASRLATEGAALLATLAIWFASSFPVYMYFLPFHVHALAAFSVSAFLWYWIKTRPSMPGDPRPLREWLRWGLLGGLMVLVYYPNAVVLLVAILEWLREGRAGRPVAERLRVGVAFVSASLLVLSPHFATKWLLHGSPLRTGLLTSIVWEAPRLGAVAFSPEHGFFLWTPVLVPAVGGLVLLLRGERFLAGALITTTLAFYYLVASYEVWHGASAFGSRFFVSLTPAFVVGLAVSIDTALRRLPRLSSRGQLAMVGVPLVLLTLWNLGFIFQWGTGLVPREGPVNFRLVARNQLTVVPTRVAGVALRYLRDRDRVVRENELAGQTP